MKELLDILFSLVNGPLTIMMIALMLYWLLTAFGLFDADSFDIDVDLDMDVDVDADLGTDVMVEDFSGAKGDELLKKKRRKLNPLEVFLVYFNFVEIPFMMTFTFFIFIWWTLCLIVTDVLNMEHTIFGFTILFALLIPALLLLKIFTTPLKSLMKNLSPKGVENLQILGRTGTTTTSISSDKIGQVQITIDDSPIKIYAMALNKGQVIAENTEVLMIKKSADSKYYLIDLNL